MRTTTYVSLLGAAVLVAVAGCTVKDVDQPALAGPSTFAMPSRWWPIATR